MKFLNSIGPISSKTVALAYTSLDNLLIGNTLTETF